MARERKKDHTRSCQIIFLMFSHTKKISIINQDQWTCNLWSKKSDPVILMTCDLKEPVIHGSVVSPLFSLSHSTLYSLLSFPSEIERDHAGTLLFSSMPLKKIYNRETMDPREREPSLHFHPRLRTCTHVTHTHTNARARARIKPDFPAAASQRDEEG